MKFCDHFNNMDSEHLYERIYEIIKYNDGTRCLRITHDGSLSALMVRLGTLVRGNWYILYVLMISHAGNRPGRYQSIEIEDYEGVRALFNDYSEFLDGDGRHNIWIGSTSNNDLLVYDRHNIIYAYGPIEAFIGILESSGFREGKISIPVPHSHSYNSTNVKYEMGILKEWEWTWSDLRESDER